MPWTIKTVKRDLPEVTVKIGKKIVPGRLSGRQNKFASVTVYNTGTLHRGTVPWMDWQVSWETVVNCLNSQKPIIV